MTERIYQTADACLPYMERYRLLLPELVVGEELPPEVEIAFVLNRNLKSNAFGLKNIDKNSLGAIPPGKSAHVIFPATPEEFVEIVMRRPFRPERDHIFKIPAGELNDLGYHALWAPIQRCPLHVRVVHASAFDLDDPMSYQVSEIAREALTLRLRELAFPS